MLEFMDEPWFGKAVLYFMALSFLSAFIGWASGMDSIMLAGGLMILGVLVFGVFFLGREFVKWWFAGPA